MRVSEAVNKCRHWFATENHVGDEGHTCFVGMSIDRNGLVIITLKGQGNEI